MSVTGVDKVPEFSGGEFTAEARQYTEGWLVTVNDKSDGGSIALQAADLPSYGEAHPNDADAYLRRLYVVGPHEGARLIWHIAGVYRTDTNDTREADPLDELPDIEWTSWAEPRILDYDKDGDAIVNSAGYPFDPGLEWEVHYPLLTITRNENDYDPAEADAYRDTVNNAQITIAGLAAAAKTARMLEYAGRNAQRRGNIFFVVRRQIAFRRIVAASSINAENGAGGSVTPAGWDVLLLDQGIYDAADSRIEDADAEVVVAPVPLDGAGAKLSNPGPSTCIFLRFEAAEEKNFSPLNLPTAASGEY